MTLSPPTSFNQEPCLPSSTLTEISVDEEYTWEIRNVKNEASFSECCEVEAGVPVSFKELGEAPTSCPSTLGDPITTLNKSEV